MRRIQISTFTLLLSSLMAFVPGHANRFEQPDKLVILNVRVTDSTQKPVTDVPQDRFQVIEDGVPQTITLFSNKQVPLTYGLMIDCSGSLRSQLPAVRNAGMKILNSNTPEDEAFLIRFISSNKLYVEQELTSDKQLLISRLADFYVEGGETALIDAVYLAAEKLAKLKIDPGNIRRKALILVTDGEDRNSFYKEEALFSLLGTTDIQIYVVGFTDELPEKSRKKALTLLNRLALDTGGRAFISEARGNLNSIFDQIILDIRTQYTIGYVPRNSTANNFHKVQVSITDDPRQDKRIAVTRVGYEALSNSTR
ncbi:MAG TPA: VWA domain-containing protein [Pyrinomonadaceae bacterium]|jgi:Ca-activated chloride channel family protein